jgi:hypothetical protein
MCIKGGLVQEWTHFVKQQHRHGLQGKRSERRARVPNSRTSIDSVLSLLLYSRMLIFVIICADATDTDVEMLC